MFERSFNSNLQLFKLGNVKNEQYNKRDKHIQNRNCYGKFVSHLCPHRCTVAVDVVVFMYNRKNRMKAIEFVTPICNSIT